MADIGNLIEGLAQATESWSGRRYLLSGSYRRKVHESWQEKSDARIFGEIIYGLFWIVFSIIILVWCFGFFTGQVSKPFTEIFALNSSPFQRHTDC